MHSRKVTAIMLIAIGLLVGAFGLLSATTGFAAGVDLGLTPEIGEEIGLGTTDIRITVARIIRTFMGLLGILAVMLILYGGFLYMTSAGNDEQVEKAKRVITQAVIGLAIILASFAIAQFVLSSLMEATTGVPFVGTGGRGAGGFGGGGSGGSRFILRGFSPTGDVPIRNVTVRAVFNVAVDAGTVDANVIVSDDTGTEVEGTYSTSGAVIEFIPITPCPSPNESRKCFDANSDFEVRIAGGLRSSSGLPISCGGLSPECSASFHTGSLVDVAPPSLVEVTAPDNGQSVYEGSLVPLQVHAVDDAGISYLDMLVDGGSVDRAVPPGLSADFYGDGFWDTDTYTLGTHRVGAIAFDLDDNTATASSIFVVLRPAHCISGVQDGDETGVDCGGSCGACGGGSCTEDSDCASGVCREGTCADVPRIDAITPRNGGPGTLVTLTGQFFGGRAGQVVFLGAPGDEDDQIASLCDSSEWYTDEITVEVPVDAVSGPLRVVTAGGELDDTDDERGPNLGSFTVDSSLRPGICNVSPRRGKTGDSVRVTGAGLGDLQESGDALFFNIGDVDTTAGTISDDNWNSTNVTASVPTLLVSDETVSFVRIHTGGLDSNIKRFTILPPEVGTLPRIDSIDPDSGSITDYVTIYGSNFGSSIGRVLFQLPDGTTADGNIDFPAICAENFWQDTQITVKVPAFYRGGAFGGSLPIEEVLHSVLVERSSDGAQSNTVGFTVSSGPPSPGICALNPDNGPEGTRVQVYGERFGSTEGTVTFTDSQVATVDGSWSGTSVQNARVPSAAVTGPMTLASAAGTISNEVTFAVGSCSSDASCGDARTCCGDGVCRDDCAGAIPAGGFAWRFSTGDIPILPEVIEQAVCTTSTQSPSPYKGTRDACVNAILSVKFTADMLESSLWSNMMVNACGTGESYDASECTDERVHPSRLSTIRETVVVDGEVSYTDRLIFQPRSFLEASRWYRVTLKADDETGMLSIDGVLLDGDFDGVEGGNYVYIFRTRPTDEPCSVDHVEVSPSDFIAIEESEKVDYRADPTAPNCNLLECTAYEWNWLDTLSDGSDSSDYVTLADNPDDPQSPPRSCMYSATALRETLSDNPVHINASIPAELKSDIGVLEIDYLDPRVTDWWPACTAACVNAEVGGQFNTSMDSATINSRTVKLLLCENESCRSFDDPGGLSTFTIEAVEDSGQIKGFRFVPLGGARLERSRYYRVIVYGGESGVLSRSGGMLSGVNYGDNFSWTFRVKDDGSLCDIDSVQVTPAHGSVNVVGDVVHYDLVPRGEPDECNQNGQILSGFAYNWEWLSVNTEETLREGIVSDVATIDFEPSGKQILPHPDQSYCSNTCLLTGSSSGFSVCGNNSVEIGEDCDYGDTSDGDGCSSRCLNEGSTGVVCGDSITGLGEDCDDGNTVSGDGCSAICLHEGIIPAAYCGNGVLDTGEDCDDGNNSGGDGCSERCLNEGSTGSAECGDGATERGTLGRVEDAAGEECDDGNTTDGDGCSALCLNEGAAAGGACGNGAVDPGEDCDDGNDFPADGCSEFCLNEGTARSILAVCGNGDLGIGEDCDDGNLSSGDGCSAVCLNEGSEPGPVSVCGNGRRESGEACDDGNATRGDGCSNSCILEGNSTRCETPLDSDCCGDFSVDSAVGESCDDGNHASGDGCSNVCTLEGSSARYGFSLSMASFCGDSTPGPTLHGTGEQCEFSDPPIDHSVDPDAFVRAAFGGDATITAVTTNFGGDIVTGEATYSLNCSCTVDRDCAEFVPPGASGSSIGCGTGSCCAPRPDVVEESLIPPISSTDICRNTLISAEFTMPMNINSFLGNVTLAERSTEIDLSCPEGRDTDVEGWCVSSVGINILGKNITSDSGATVTEMQAQITAALAPSTSYTVIIAGDTDLLDDEKEGVLSANGVGMAGNYVWDFTTGDLLCTLDQVTVDPETWLFSTAQNDPTDDVSGSPTYDQIPDRDKVYAAESLTRRGDLRGPEPIVAIPGVYNWEWDWASSDGERDDPSTWQHFEQPSSGRQSTVLRTTDAPINGDATITAKATVSENILAVSCSPGGSDAEQALQCGAGRRCSPSGSATEGHCYGESKSASGVATLLLCENPWPSRNPRTGDWAPQTDTDYTYSYYYCRDAGEAATTSDDLPAPPSDEPILVTRPGRATGAMAADVLRDTLMPLDCETTSGPCKDGDAIGFRVLKNDPHMSASRWYTNAGFTGSPSPIQMDGYGAIQDGRSVYVNAGTKVGDPDLYTNIYLLSYSEGADSITQNIFGQILENLRFNTNLQTQNERICSVNVCSNDGSACTLDSECGDATCGPVSCSIDQQCSEIGGTCNASKDKFIRDVQRLEHFVEINNAFERYYTLNQFCESAPDRACLRDEDCGLIDRCIGSYPDISSGSFVRGLSTSKWSSWQATLGNALGSGLPQDPINQFRQPCSVAGGYEQESCWNASAQTYICPDGSNIYQYSKQGRGYEFGAEFEFKFCELDPSQLCSRDADCGLGDRCIVQNWTTGMTPTSHSGADITNLFKFDHLCTDTIVSAAAGTCGDGVIGVGEECEIGDTGGVTCVLSGSGGRIGLERWSCGEEAGVDACQIVTSGTCEAGRCGDGITQAPELCDDGLRNGQYGFCRDDCGLNPSGLAYGARCGDGDIQAVEACDFGGVCTLTGDPCTPATGVDCDFGTQGVCVGRTFYHANPDLSCAADCATVGPYCGDGFVDAASGGEECEGDATETRNCTDSEGAVIIDAATGREMIQSRSCNPLCRWDRVGRDSDGFGVCTPAGTCGDGEVQEPEACDDGNDSNTDVCTNECILNICGDSYVNPAAEECDLGSRNIDATDSDAVERSARASCPYGSRCAFCTIACRQFTVTGGVCGDGVLAPSYEICERSIPREDWVSPELYDDTSFCSADCTSACPPTYSENEVRFQARSSSGVFQERSTRDITLRSNSEEYDIVFPACRPGTLHSLTADISLLAETAPMTDVLFMIDLSGSMNYGPDGDTRCSSDPACTTRMDLLKPVLTDDGTGAVDQLVEAFRDNPGSLRIGLVTFQGSSGSPIIQTTGDYITGATELLPVRTRGSSVRALKDAINGFIASGGTPTRSGAESARDILNNPANDGHRKILILLSDGEPYRSAHPPPPDQEPGAVLTELKRHGLSIDQRQGAEVFTITFNSDSSLFRDMQNWAGVCIHNELSATPACSSSTSNETGFRLSAVVGQFFGPLEGMWFGPYAFQSSGDLSGIYRTIVSAITAVVTDIGGESVDTPEGTGVTLPGAGTLISCTGSAQNFPFTVRFGGEGEVRVANVRLAACPLAPGAPGGGSSAGSGAGGSVLTPTFGGAVGGCIDGYVPVGGGACMPIGSGSPFAPFAP